VARWVLGPLGVARLVWRAELGNHASRLVAERIGVRGEGVLRRSARNPEGELAGMWGGSLLPGGLLGPGQGADPVRTLRARTFTGDQPVLPVVTDAGEEITLRPGTAGDIADVVAAFQDPESIRWTVAPDPYREADARSYWIDEVVPGQWRRG